MISSALMPHKTMSQAHDRISCRLHFGLSTVAILLPAALGVADPRFAAAENLSPAAIKQRLVEAHRKLESISLQYRVDAGGGNYLVRTISAKAPFFLFHDSAHGGPGLDPALDVDRQVTYVVKEKWVTYRPLSRTIVTRSIQPNDGVPGSLPEELFFIATAIWPIHGRQPPSPLGHVHFLFDVASSAEFQVHDGIETIAGQPCRLITHETGRDRIWVDVDKGCCVVRREFYDEDRVTPLSRLTMTQHRMVAKDVWIPFRIHRTDFDTRATQQLGAQPRVLDLVAEMDYVRCNDVSDEVFEFVAPPGTLELEPEGETDEPRQIVAGGIDLLDEQARWIQSRAKIHEPHGRGMNSLWISLVAFIVIGTAIRFRSTVVQFYRSMRTIAMR